MMNDGRGDTRAGVLLRLTGVIVPSLQTVPGIKPEISQIRVFNVDSENNATSLFYESNSLFNTPTH